MSQSTTTTKNTNVGHNIPTRKSSNEIAAEHGIPMSVAQPTLVAYRSVGIGVFGAVMRWAGMPLEKIALYMNSSQVSGKNQLGQAIRLTFQDGALAPYKVVGPASVTAWFMQYSIMGVAFQFFDQSLSNLMGVRQMYYGAELMEPPDDNQNNENLSPGYNMKFAVKTFISPVLAACLESAVSNRAEVQRFYGPKQFAQMEVTMGANALVRAAGPAFAANTMRNVIMCQTSFLLTPLTYKLYFPQEHKSKTSLFWYGLGLNMFVGNVIAIKKQSLWGRSLDYLRVHGHISYQKVIQQGLEKEGMSAFFTVPKWGSRVLMNAPAQGTLPWFYNEVLPLGESAFMGLFQAMIYQPFLHTTQEIQCSAEESFVVLEHSAQDSVDTPSITASSPSSTSS
jgi:hypothetical protein